MKWVVPIQRWEDREEVFTSPADEVLVGAKSLSRLGRLDLSELPAVASQLLAQGKKAILVWDILMTEEVMRAVTKLLKTIDLSFFSAIRIQDPGALLWVQQNLSQVDVHLVLENGNHNLEALKGWIELGGAQLKRVVFSPQIPKSKLREFIFLAQSFNVGAELMVLGSLLLFYSPRSLVKRLYDREPECDYLMIKADSEESPHKGFPVVENDWGTFMFHPKDLGLVESIFELRDMGLEAVRFDLFDGRPLSVMTQLKMALSPADIKKVLQREYPYPLIKGFFQVNKSDILFKKLKNQKIAERGESYLGDVVDVEKKSYIAIHIRNPKKDLRLKDILEYRTPEGRVKTSQVVWLKNSDGRERESLSMGQVALLNHTSGISVKTAVYWQ